MGELLPCPFCGSTDVSVFMDDDFVSCFECRTYGPNGGIEAWNSRASADPRGFTEWEHEPDEFDRQVAEDARARSGNQQSLDYRGGE